MARLILHSESEASLYRAVSEGTTTYQDVLEHVVAPSSWHKVVVIVICRALLEPPLRCGGSISYPAYPENQDPAKLKPTSRNTIAIMWA